MIQHTVALLAMVVGWCTGRKGYFRKASYFAGLTLFWFFSGLFAVSVGIVLWLGSWPKGVLVLIMQWSKGGASGVRFTTQVTVLLCGVVMPLMLAYQWLLASTIGTLWQYMVNTYPNTETGYNEIKSDSPQNDGIVGKALTKLGPGGLSVQQLREYLDDPMKDPVVQRDEETRETTVEHLKLLRHLLEAKVKIRVDELDATTAARLESLQAALETNFGGIVDDRIGALSKKLDEVTNKLADTLRGLEGAED